MPKTIKPTIEENFEVYRSMQLRNIKDENVIGHFKDAFFAGALVATHDIIVCADTSSSVEQFQNQMMRLINEATSYAHGRVAIGEAMNAARKAAANNGDKDDGN